MTLDWHEVLWFFSGGMAGSHLRWSVYEDMVNRVWPQCSEQERRNIWLIARRDLGWSWRPRGWQGHAYMQATDEGPWLTTRADGIGIDPERPDEKPAQVIHDVTPWQYFRRVLSRFSPYEQVAVTLRCPSAEVLRSSLRPLSPASILRVPDVSSFGSQTDWTSETATLTVRAYRHDGELFVDWSRRIDPDSILSQEPMTLPDDGTM